MKIVFFGTPEFAVASLEAIYNSSHEIACIVTSTDKPAGRNRYIRMSEVKKWSLDKNINILQPHNLKDPIFLSQLESFQADIFVVVAFRIMPTEVWSSPTLGTINLHASLLPDYRGAAPINWAIMNGETSTGLTTFKLKQKVDTGDILLQEKISIEPEMNATELHNVLKTEGAKLLVKTLDLIEKEDIQPKPQIKIIESQKKAPKITPDICEINTNHSVKVLQNKIRGLSLYPGAYINIKNKRLKILSSTAVVENTNRLNITYVTDYKNHFGLVCPDGILYLNKVLPEGKKMMSIQEYLNGYGQFLKTI